MADTKKTTIADTTQQHLGTVYAKALIGAAEKLGQTDQVLSEFDALIGEILDQLPQLDAALSSPRVSLEQKERLIDKTVSGRVTDTLRDFLKVVARHGRLNCLRAIQQSAKRLNNDLRGRVEVLVRSAEPLSEALLESVRTKLAATLGLQIVLQTTVDPGLLGGLLVRVGDTVYDGSVTTRLDRMRDEALDHTAQQIRNDLDRFAPATAEA